MSRTHLTPADLIVLKARLTQAQDALHQLYIGKAVVTVRDSNGEMITYQNASIGELAAYVQSLERQVNGSHRPRPTYPLF